LHSFDFSETYPEGELLQTSGTLFGTTVGQGSTYSTVWSYVP